MNKTSLKYMSVHASLLGIKEEVLEECFRQLEKWGIQDHNPMIYVSILNEEVGEVNKDIVDAHFASCPEARTEFYKRCRTELIQVAAVAMQIVSSMDRNELKK